MTIKLHDFYRQFEDLPKDVRFEMIDYPSEPTSLFVIFQQLTQVRAQLRYFEKREAHLLEQAELGFQQIKIRDDN